MKGIISVTKTTVPFFYQSEKVTSDVIRGVREKKDTPHSARVSIFNIPTQKYKKCARRMQKSLKCLAFKDLIFKIALRLNLFLLIYIIYVNSEWRRLLKGGAEIYLKKCNDVRRHSHYVGVDD